MACIRSSMKSSSSRAKESGVSRMESYGNSTSVQLHEAHRNIIQIYTDWANHYLEKSRSKRHIQDLQVDVTDGVILSDVVEAVTNQKVPDIIRKPKNGSQMLDNIQSCLVFLLSVGVTLDGISARDIRDGHLKSILTLFFQLSRYKQEQKGNPAEMQSAVYSSPPGGYQHQLKYGGRGSSTSIPLPGSISNSSHSSSNSNSNGGIKKPSSGGAGERNLKNNLTASSSHLLYSPGKPGSGNSSRSTSPMASNGTNGHSFIPTPRSSIPSAPNSARSSLHIEKGSKMIPTTTTTNQKSSPARNGGTPTTAVINDANSGGGGSMLEKFKFFKEKDKREKIKTSKGTNSNNSSSKDKRTSSSSGFSSARSERSDSSISLSNDAKVVPSDVNIVAHTPSFQNENDEKLVPKTGIKGFRQKIGKAISASPSNLKEAKKIPTSAPQNQNSSSLSGPHNENSQNSNSLNKGKMGPNENPASFLRQPKTVARESKLRYSGTGIPTRNSLISPNNNSREFSPNHSLESISNNSAQSIPTTSIPKPTALVKGNAKIPPPQIPLPKESPKNRAIETTKLVSNEVDKIEEIEGLKGVENVNVDKVELRNGNNNETQICESIESVCKKVSEVIAECEEDEMLLNVKPMEPLEPILRNSPYGYMKSPPSSSSKLINKNGGHFAFMSQQSRDYDYADIDTLEVTVNGYLSDGDLLSSENRGGMGGDGYMSESGIRGGYLKKSSIYHKKEPLQDASNVVTNNTERSRKGITGRRRFDDSSSLSSGISDLNEIPTDITSSSINSDPTSPYASLQRLGGSGDICKNKTIDPQSIIYRVVGCRSGNKQTSSSSTSSSPKHGIISLAHNKSSSQLVSNGHGPDSIPPRGMMGKEEYRSGGSSGSSDGSNGRRNKNLSVGFGYVRRGGPNKYMVSSKEDVSGSISLVPTPGNGTIDAMGIHYIPAPPPKGRTKVKVSGGTQTTSDLQAYNHSHSHPHHHILHHAHKFTHHHSSTGDVVVDQEYSNGGAKSLSLTSPTAAQLSQSLRERILGSQSLPKGANSSADYAAILAQIQQQHSVYGTPNASRERMGRYAKMLSGGGGGGGDDYANYSEIGGGPNYSWMRHSTGYASSITSAPTRLISGGSMTEAESLESLASNSSLAHQLRNGRSNGQSNPQNNNGTNGAHQREESPSGSPRLNRSNSISHFRERTFPRSTKSEKLYPSMLQRTEEAYYANANALNNVPNSAMHTTPNRNGDAQQQRAYGSNGHNVRLSMSPYSGFLAKISTKEDEINASSLSLVSTASSIYSTQEEKQAYEMRKLKRELQENQDKISTLTNQLSTNAHVVAAFEQSLANMTQRLQNLTLTAEQKDSELIELRQTIELLRKQSIEAGLTVAHFNSCVGGLSRDGSPLGRQLSADSVSSINSISSACSGASHSHASSPSSSHPTATVHMSPSGAPHNSAQHHPPSSPGKKQGGKGKGWLRSSFNKAFSRSKGGKGRESIESDEMSLGNGHSPSNCREEGIKNIPNGHHHHHHGQLSSSKGTHGVIMSNNVEGSCGSSVSNGSSSPYSNTSHLKGSSSSSAIDEEGCEKHKSVDDLKKQLREKEMVLTDIRLEALTSAHQLESLKETVSKMRNEMLSLKQDNERLQRLVTSKSLNASQSSLPPSSDTADHRLSTAELSPSTNIDVLLADPSGKEGKRIIVTVFLGSHGSNERFLEENYPTGECAIGTVLVSSRTKWDLLDSLIRRAFKEYVMRVDPVTNLGLSPDSISSYNVGEIVRVKEGSWPELLPCGYLVGDVNKIRICLRGAIQGSVDALAFETLIPKSTLQRHVSSLSEFGRLIISGPSGTGKSYLSRKLAEFLTARSPLSPPPILTFVSDEKNGKELKTLLTTLCTDSSLQNPSVLLIDNLHKISVSLLPDLFSSFSNSFEKRLVIIGTSTQVSSTSNLTNWPNFRKVHLANATEPVKGFLSRFLQRRLIESEIVSGRRNGELGRVLEWIPEIWSHINRILEKFHSGDVTIGPRLFLSCPSDVANSQAWFTDLWNYSLVPYLSEALKEGFGLYGRRGSWEDPAGFLISTYPWVDSPGLSTSKSSLLRLRPEDVGYDNNSCNNNKNGVGGLSNGDPLLNMLMRLQEAANYSEPQSDIDSSTSLDSSHCLDSKDFTGTA